MTPVSLFLCACLSLSCVAAGRTLYHWFQLESYQFPGYFRTILRSILKALLPGAVLGAVFFLLSLGAGAAFSGNSPWIPAGITGAGTIICAFVLRRKTGIQKAKKALVYTARMKRLTLISLPVLFALLCAVNALFPDGYGAYALFCLLLPLWIALCGLMAWPVEKAVSEAYFRDAQRILRERDDLIRIGITGSWGKTSVKFILGTLLQEKYNTLITPASYNTPMGVTKVIRSSLEPGHRVFVAEMGARHVGDIREMCRLVHPQMGVLTSVGPQHLDTFKTLDRIRKTKYELMEAVPENGCCFFADDDDIVLDLYEKTEKKKILAGMNADRDDVWAEDLRSTPKGSTFTLCMDGERYPCHTELLGELNVRNIVLSASVCRELGMSGREISRGISKIKSIEHRLQLISNPGGITVIDDAFNSNIKGAAQAFQVLKEFPGRRIVVTPGMVELGEREEELNREFGRKMAGCCDMALLIGRNRSRSIAEGMMEAGAASNQIVVVNSLAEATEYLAAAAAKGDTILFENDLPDNYNEK